MSQYASVNFSLIDSSDASIPALSAAAIYGRSAFTSLAFANNHLFLWESHLRRLSAHCQRLSIAFEGDSQRNLEDAVREVVKANGLSQARVRITIADTGPTLLWPYKLNGNSPALIIAAEELAWHDQSMRLGVSERTVNSTSLMTGIKSGNYLEPLLCLDEARGRGFDEAIRSNERGEIVSACLANVFWCHDGAVFTPPLAAGCLAGTIRQWLLDNFGVTERVASLGNLAEADEIFLTSSGIGLRSAFIDDVKESPIAEMLRAKLVATLRAD